MAIRTDDHGQLVLHLKIRPDKCLVRTKVLLRDISLLVCKTGKNASGMRDTADLEGPMSQDEADPKSPTFEVCCCKARNHRADVINPPRWTASEPVLRVGAKVAGP